MFSILSAKRRQNGTRHVRACQQGQLTLSIRHKSGDLPAGFKSPEKANGIAALLGKLPAPAGGRRQLGLSPEDGASSGHAILETTFHLLQREPFYLSQLSRFLIVCEVGLKR